jgi:hypothetical protein
MAKNPQLDIAPLTDQRRSGFPGTRCKAAYHLPRDRIRQLQTGDRIRFDPSNRSIERIADNGVAQDELMVKLAAEYQEPEWPRTGTIKDLVNRQLLSTSDGCGII